LNFIGLFALRALPDPETLNARLAGLQKLIQSKPLPFEDVRLPIQKGYIRLPKLQKHVFSQGYNNRDYREDGENRSIGGVAYGPPLLPPITRYTQPHPPTSYLQPPASNYPIPPSTIDSVNPFKRYRFPYNPPTSSTSTIIPGVGYNTFDPQSIYDPATTTRSAPPTRGTNSKPRDLNKNFDSDFNLGLAPGP
jgi:hypothetical protein